MLVNIFFFFFNVYRLRSHRQATNNITPSYVYRTNNVPLNVLHQLKVGTLGLYFFHRSGGYLVDKVAKHDAVLQMILIRDAFRNRLAQNIVNPLHHLFFLFLVFNLQKKKKCFSLNRFRYTYRVSARTRYTL